jgi:hypothetical protein
MVLGAKALSRALYLLRRMERAAQIARRNNYPFFTAQTFRASGGGEYGLTRETRMERAAKCFYSAKI